MQTRKKILHSEINIALHRIFIFWTESHVERKGIFKEKTGNQLKIYLSMNIFHLILD